jgi:ribosome-associated protein
MAPDDVVTPGGVRVPAEAISVTFARSGGPGGQHVNTSATKARVTVAVDRIPLDDERAARLHQAFGRRVEATSQQHRSQWRNRQTALERVLARIDDALTEDAPRRPTRMSRGAKQRRRAEKQQRSRRKAERRGEWD